MNATSLRIGGFTFIELMVSLSIMSVLALLAVPLAASVAVREKERELRIALFQIREAIDAYKRAAEQGRIILRLGDSGYPPDLNALVAGVPDQRSPTGQMLYFLRRVPVDPMVPPGQPVGAGWGLRSSASPPGEPSSGSDVYDVYSTSGDVGVNGVPYRNW
jgi:general secretion pathway protein G